MPRYAKTLASVAIVILIALWALLPTRFDVISPRLGMPAIVQGGDTVQLTLRTSTPLWRPDWRVWLGRRGKRIPVTDTQIATQFTTATLSFSVPATLSAGAYSLIVTDGGGDREQVRPKALHVVANFPDQVSIVQMADLPTLGGDGKGDRQFQQIINEINIINPNLVLMTGDVAYGGHWDQYKRLLAAMEDINAPVIAAPGNHEYEGWAGYLTLLGKPFHSVRYGKLEFINLNSGHGRDQLTETQYAWLQGTLQQRDGRIPVLQIHHPLFHRPSLHGFLVNHVHDVAALVKQSSVPIVLSGHWHGDAVYDDTGRDRRDTWDFPGTPYVVTTTAGADLRKAYASSPLHHGYRLIRLDHGKLVSYTYDMDGDGRRDPTSSIPVGKLRSAQPDSRSAWIENQLHEEFSHARAVIKVPCDEPGLVPDTGHIVERYQADNATIYVIELALPANSRREIHLRTKDQAS